MINRSRQRLRLLALAVVVSILMIPSVWFLAHARTIQHVSILMPAPFAEASKPLISDFNQKHRGEIHLNAVRGPLETEAISDLAISSLLLGDAPFDALLMDVTWLPKYAAAGWLVPLDSWFSDSDLNALASGAREGNSFDGTLYRWPFTADMGLLYWRTDLMDEPPTTPEQLVKVSQSLQQQARVPWGYVWQGRQYEGLSCVFLELIEGFGGFWMQPETGAIGLDQSAGLKASTWLRDLITSGVSPQAVTNYAESEALQSFKVGDAALMRNWPYAWAELQKSDSAVKGHVGVTTMVSEAGSPPTATLGSWGLAILQTSSHREATAEAIRFLTSEDSQKKLYLKYGYTPTIEGLFRDPELTADNPILPDLLDALKYTRSRPETPLYAQFSDVLQRDLSGVLTGQRSPLDGMKQATTTSRTILRSAGEVIP